MFYTRKLNSKTGQVEIWECEWSATSAGMTKKVFVRKHCNEGDEEAKDDGFAPAAAICWAPGRTIGNIAVNSENVLGSFTGRKGDNAILPCDVVPCGKYRNGKKRWYCKTHQIHWGVKADLAAALKSGEINCSNHLMGMSYVVNPFVVKFNNFLELGVWCSLPPAMSSKTIEKRPPRIHIHKRFTGAAKKVLDKDFNAVVCSYDKGLGLFESNEITQIQITPPAAFEFVRSIEDGRLLNCVTCKRCGYPHLDLGNFAKRPHAKHFCGNCGNDSIRSKGKIVSTPLKPLHDQFNNSNRYIVPARVLNLDEYNGFDFDLWSSTPAVLWTANRPQEKGIHVHVYKGVRRVVDNTFGKVIYRGKELDRKALWRQMTKNTIY